MQMILRGAYGFLSSIEDKRASLSPIHSPKYTVPFATIQVDSCRCKMYNSVKLRRLSAVESMLGKKEGREMNRKE